MSKIYNRNSGRAIITACMNLLSVKTFEQPTVNSNYTEMCGTDLLYLMFTENHYCLTVNVVDPLLLIEKSSLCGGSGFPSKKCVKRDHMNDVQ